MSDPRMKKDKGTGRDAADPKNQKHETTSRNFSAYIVIVTGVVTPLAIAGLTGWLSYSFNQTQLAVNRTQECLKQHISLIDSQSKKDETPDRFREEVSNRLIEHVALLQKYCKEVGIQVPDIVKRELVATTENSTSRDIAARAARVFADDPNESKDSAALKDVMKAVDTPPPRIYLHVSSANQIDAANELKKWLEGQQVDGKKIRVPAITVSKTQVKKDVFKCFKVEECNDVGKKLLALIDGHISPRAVSLENLSSLYQHSSANRPFHFELWFAPGQIDLRK